jgi:hypothetical protein
LNVLREYHLPQRDALTVTLYEEGLIEIKQTSPMGTEETSPPVMLDTHDLGDLMNMLDSARLAWMRRHEQPQEPLAKKKGPPAAG